MLALTPYGVAHVTDPEINNTLQSIFEPYIKPEIQRRIFAGATLESLLPY